LKASASNIETRSPPALARCFPRSFTFYVADPASSIPKPIFFKSAASNVLSQVFQ
jgi:hypothetical protein